MYRTLPHAFYESFYEFRGIPNADPTPWEYGYEQDDFTNDRYTLTGLSLLTLGSDTLVRIIMISETDTHSSRLPVSLMKELFDRFDCVRAIRFTSYLPTDMSSFQCDELMRVRDYMVRRLGDHHWVESHCRLCHDNYFQFEFDVYVYYRMIDEAMKGSPMIKDATCYYPSVHFRRISPSRVELEIDSSRLDASIRWDLPQQDIVYRLQRLCGVLYRLDGIRISIPQKLSPSARIPLTALVDSLTMKRREYDKAIEWETSDDGRMTILLDLLPPEEEVNCINKLLQQAKATQEEPNEK